MKGLLTSLITVLTFTGLQAQSLPAAPKLVVGLTIDQLRTDYLEAFSSLYGEKGFKRLWKEGRVFYNAEYTFSGTDRESAMAAIYTGTTPSVNRIIDKRWKRAAIKAIRDWSEKWSKKHPRRLLGLKLAGFCFTTLFMKFTGRITGAV